MFTNDCTVAWIILHVSAERVCVWEGILLDFCLWNLSEESKERKIIVEHVLTILLNASGIVIMFDCRTLSLGGKKGWARAGHTVCGPDHNFKRGFFAPSEPLEGLKDLWWFQLVTMPSSKAQTNQLSQQLSTSSTCQELN